MKSEELDKALEVLEEGKDEHGDGGDSDMENGSGTTTPTARGGQDGSGGDQ